MRELSFASFDYSRPSTTFNNSNLRTENSRLKSARAQTILELLIITESVEVSSNQVRLITLIYMSAAFSRFYCYL